MEARCRVLGETSTVQGSGFQFCVQINSKTLRQCDPPPFVTATGDLLLMRDEGKLPSRRRQSRATQGTAAWRGCAVALRRFASASSPAEPLRPSLPMTDVLGSCEARPRPSCTPPAQWPGHHAPGHRAPGHRAPGHRACQGRSLQPASAATPPPPAPTQLP